MEKHRCVNILKPCAAALRCLIQVNFDSPQQSGLHKAKPTVQVPFVLTRDLDEKGFRLIISGMSINGSTMTMMSI